MSKAFNPKFCISCGVKLEDCDRDPNGDANCVCAKCRAEECHDFDKDPQAVFDRQGRRTDLNQDRYYVDERVGCIAVRDRLDTNPDDNGLHEDTQGVVKYWAGFQQKHLCPTCHQVTHTEWMVKDSDRADAIELCFRLNQKNPS